MNSLIRIVLILGVVITGMNRLYATQQDVQKAFIDVRYGDYNAVLQARLTKQDIVTGRNKEGNTLIAEAIASFPAAKVLLGAAQAQAKLQELIAALTTQLAKSEKDKVLNAQNTNGQTALMLAAQQGLTDVVDQLHRLGALAIFKDTRGKTASDYTRSYSLKKTITYWEDQEERELKELEEGWETING